MTIISKVLAVFVAAASLLFLGFVAVTLKAGANWEGEARKVELYQFSQTAGDPPTWSAAPDPHDKTVYDLQAVPATRVLPDAIIKAQANVQDQYKQRIDYLDQQIAQYEQEIATFRAEKAVDREALDVRQQELRSLLEAADAQIADLNKQADELSQQASAVEATAVNRREEGRRLATELAAVTAEKHRWLSQKEILEDRLVRLRESIASLERRQAQLKSDARPPAGD